MANSNFTDLDLAKSCLRDEGLDFAAKALTQHARLRQLPSHGMETLLVYSNTQIASLRDFPEAASPLPIDSVSASPRSTVPPQMQVFSTIATAARASRILDAQNPATITKFEIGDVISEHLLPNGIPLLDHAIGAFATQPG